MPDVQGRCPACGAASLFLGEGGHVTCARIECPNPCAADDMLHGEAATPRRAGDALGCRIPETLTKGISRDDYALAPSASEPPVVAAARIQLNAAPASDTVPVPPGAFDRLVRVAMWVSRGRSMAHTPDPQISGSYPDTAARFALGALDDAGLLNTYREKASGRPTHPDGTPYRYHEIVAEGWGHCDGCRTWGQGWTAENPHNCPGTYVKGPSTEEAPREP